MGADYGKLDVKRRVEHNIGRFLEGEYPLVLGLAHTLPLTDSLAGSEGSLVVIADDATQQAVILRGNPVVVVELYAGKGRDIDLVLLRVGNLVGEQGVQGMDTLDDEYAVVAELELLAVPLALAGNKIVLWNLYYLALHQALKMLA